MAWFKLDDQAYDHPKFAKAGNEAIGAWCRAGMWCSKHLTDGVLPREVALTIATEKVWARLESVGLLDKHDDGWAIHDFLDWNPSRADVLAERNRKATNMATSRGRGRPVTAPVTGHTRDTDRAVTGNEPDTKHGPVPVPVPVPARDNKRSLTVQSRENLSGDLRGLEVDADPEVQTTDGGVS